MTLPSISDWIARLEPAHIFCEVAETGDLAARLSEGSVAVPAAYVGYVSEDADIVTLGGLLLITATMAVVYVVQHRAGDEMSGAYGLHEAKAQARGLLHGWRPHGASHPVEFVSGQVESVIESNAIIWQDIFTMQYTMPVGGS